jgi:predicted permease
MKELIHLFSANLLPILITAGTGLILVKTVQLDPRTLSRVIFYLFSPCLVFQLLVNSQLEENAIAQIFAYAITFQILIAVITFGITRLLKLERKLSVAIILTASITNAGNFGLSFNKFAFGEEALAYAGIFFIASSIMVYTFGVAVASMGKTTIKESILNLFKFPPLYALIAAGIFNSTGWHLPIPIERVTNTLADGAIPAMLVLLGIQLGNAKIRGNTGPIALATGIRLVAAPFIAVALSIPFGLTGAAYQAGISEASTPTAVMTSILATEFDAEPALVSTIIAATTILSPLTLTPLMAFLGGTAG